MKQLIRLALFSLLMYLIPTSALCETIPIVLVQADTNYTPPVGVPNLGHRTSSLPISCIIDLENNRIISTSSLVNNVELYKIYHTDGVCIFITDSETEFIESLKNLHGACTISLCGNNYELIGPFFIN